MDKQEFYLQTIQQIYPDLLVASVKTNTHGQNNDILIINDEIIFRFPRYSKGIEQLETEAAILTGTQHYVTLNIPNITFNNLITRTVGQAFVGYTMIPGEPFWRGTLAAVQSKVQLGILAEQLAGFLKELHGVPVKMAIARELSLSDTHEEWVNIYTRIKEKCFPYMRLKARNWATNHFETFLSNPHNFDYAPVLKHGDFGASNILFNTETQTINGIIDFSNAGLGDPAYDFAGILSSYGESFLRRLCESYPESETFWERILFYSGTFALLEALFGIENNDKDAFKSGIASYI